MKNLKNNLNKINKNNQSKANIKLINQFNLKSIRVKFKNRKRNNKQKKLTINKINFNKLVEKIYVKK